MRAWMLGVSAALALGACAVVPYAPVVPMLAVAAPDYSAALADPRRPAEDVARDAARKPAETLAFAGIGPGARVGELLPGGGYFTRIIAVAVGAEGRVYPTIRPPGVAGQYETPILPIAALYSNASVAQLDLTVLDYPEPLDVVFTAQNYHDLHIAEYNLGEANAANRAAFRALKPGGLYVIVDHAAAPGMEMADALAIHRIDEAQVRREVEAAGFEFVGSSDILRNPDDARTQNVFDPAIRGRTDQFVLKFRKPA